MVTTLFVVSSTGSSTRGLESSLEAALESVGSSCLQQFENTVVLQRTFIHLISTSTESHNRDNATKGKRNSFIVKR
jgi:hypothetical protein